MAEILIQSQLNYLNELRIKPDPLIEEMELFAKENRVPILNWKAAELLEHIILISNPKRVLEIGTAIAYSSIVMARRLRKKGIVDTIEKSLDNIALATDYIKRAELSDKINLIEGDALSIMPKLEKKYDLIFLDADKEDYEKLFYYSLMLLKKDGILIVDNLMWHGYAASTKVPSAFKNSTKIIREFNKLFLNHDAIKSIILPVGDGIGIGVKI